MSQEQFHDRLFMAVVRRDLPGLLTLIQLLDHSEDVAWAEVVAGLLNQRLEPTSECWLVEALTRSNCGWKILVLAMKTREVG